MCVVTISRVSLRNAVVREGLMGVKRVREYVFGLLWQSVGMCFLKDEGRSFFYQESFCNKKTNK